MGLKIKGDLLEGDNVKFEKTPNHGGTFTPDSIVIHYTAGPSLKSAVRTLTSPRVSASAHLVIDRDGSIVQLAPFNIVTWHAGRSSYAGRKGYNNYSIGIEIVNEGVLKKSGSVFRSWSGKKYSEHEVVKAIHRNQTTEKYWHTYSEEQIETVLNICELLLANYDIKYILGHEEIAPKRKTDPGPAFPLDKFRERLLGTTRDEEGIPDLPDTGRIIANTLNIRSKPNTKASKVAKPLQKGKKVVILDEHNGWYKVSVSVVGWVFGKYVDIS